MRIGDLVGWVGYNRTWTSWNELKEYLNKNNIPYIEYNVCVPIKNKIYAREIKISAYSIPNIRKMWKDLKLTGDPIDLDYVIFYDED